MKVSTRTNRDTQSVAQGGGGRLLLLLLILEVGSWRWSIQDLPLHWFVYSTPTQCILRCFGLKELDTVDRMLKSGNSSDENQTVNLMEEVILGVFLIANVIGYQFWWNEATVTPLFRWSFPPGGAVGENDKLIFLIWGIVKQTIFSKISDSRVSSQQFYNIRGFFKFHFDKLGKQLPK